MPTTEHTINDALAELLRGTRRAWRHSDIVSSENTGQLKGSTARPRHSCRRAKRLACRHRNRSISRYDRESEAIARLGAQLKLTGRTILSSVAMRLPLRLREKSGRALQKDLLGELD
jgi:hypothetical protein